MTTATQIKAATRGGRSAFRAHALSIPDGEDLIVAARIVARLKTWGDGCWLITDRPHPKGNYGTVQVDGVPHAANRAAYALINGPIPAGMCVCHHCDTPGCVRPDHLFLASHAGNMHDRRAKDRYDLGAENPNARLVEADVVIIRALASSGVGPVAIARQLGLPRTTVRDVLTGRTWRHVPDAADARKERAA